MGKIKVRNKVKENLILGASFNLTIEINGAVFPLYRITAMNVDEDGMGVTLGVEELYYDSKE